MLKKIFISAVLILAVLSFVVSLLKGNNNAEKTVTVPDRVAVINISGTIISGADSKYNLKMLILTCGVNGSGRAYQ